MSSPGMGRCLCPGHTLAPLGNGARETGGLLGKVMPSFARSAVPQHCRLSRLNNRPDVNSGLTRKDPAAGKD